ncbi:hypothetical protein [Actinomadura sp. WMMA1423]|uniref:hypothetical protein n=1 Tax=Actinomadura sp. WMMA1423 TaxID=2591108 RepID=UPI001146DD57|nr:hypothetical protein [Actinomadura sp. WMMA1423]
MPEQHPPGPSHRPPRRPARPHPPAEPPPRLRGWLRTPAGCATAIATPLVLALILFVVAQAFDTPAAKDKVRAVTRPGGDQDVRWSVSFNDPAYQIATPRGVALTPPQKRFLRTWRFGGQAEGPGHSLSGLINEVRAVGGANLDALYLMVRLEGRRNQPLFVDDVRPVNIRRTRPYAGTLVDIPPQEGGEPFKMIFNFDEFEPRAREVEDDVTSGGRPGDLFFNHNTITVKDGQQDSIGIKSISTRTAVTFQIRIVYHLGGRPKTLTIDNRGNPFALTPYNCTKRTKPIKDGFAPGRVSYQDVWRMGAAGRREDAIGRVAHSSTPGSQPVDSPTCLAPMK